MWKMAIGLSALAAFSGASAWGADLPTKKPSCHEVTIERDRALLNGRTGNGLVNPASNTVAFLSSAGTAADVKAAAALEPYARAEIDPSGGASGSVGGDLSTVARQTRDQLIANPGDIATVVKNAALADPATRLEMELGIVRAIRYTQCYDPAGYQALSSFMNANASDPVVSAVQSALSQVASASSGTSSGIPGAGSGNSGGWSGGGGGFVSNPVRLASPH